MTRHLNISPLHRRDHARATTPRGTCTAAEGLDAETFRGFQLAGELFLLTSFFIEPKGCEFETRLRSQKMRTGRMGLTPPAPLFKCALHSLWRRDIRAPRFLTSAFLKMALKGF